MKSWWQYPPTAPIPAPYERRARWAAPPAADWVMMRMGHEYTNQRHSGRARRRRRCRGGRLRGRAVACRDHRRARARRRRRCPRAGNRLRGTVTDRGRPGPGLHPASLPQCPPRNGTLRPMAVPDPGRRYPRKPAVRGRRAGRRGWGRRSGAAAVPIASGKALAADTDAMGRSGFPRIRGDRTRRGGRSGCVDTKPGFLRHAAQPVGEAARAGSARCRRGRADVVDGAHRRGAAGGVRRRSRAAATGTMASRKPGGAVGAETRPGAVRVRQRHRGHTRFAGAGPGSHRRAAGRHDSARHTRAGGADLRHCRARVRVRLYGGALRRVLDRIRRCLVPDRAQSGHRADRAGPGPTLE